MTQTLRGSGDLLERANIDFIEARLPSYATLWVRCIGNDGHAHLPLQDRLAGDVQRKRQRLAQFSYSALESLLCARRLVTEAEKLNLSTSNEAELAAEHLRALDLRIVFFAHVGRVVDCARKIALLVKNRTLAEPLNELYQKRNTILHDAAVPTFLTDGLLEFVEPAGGEADNQTWSNAKLWTEAGDLRRVWVNQYLPRLFDDLVREYENFLFQFNLQHSRTSFSGVETELMTLADHVFRHSEDASMPTDGLDSLPVRFHKSGSEGV